MNSVLFGPFVTTKVTEIGQIYVVMPVPESVRKAGK